MYHSATAGTLSSTTQGQFPALKRLAAQYLVAVMINGHVPAVVPPQLDRRQLLLPLATSGRLVPQCIEFWWYIVEVSDRSATDDASTLKGMACYIMASKELCNDLPCSGTIMTAPGGHVGTLCRDIWGLSRGSEDLVGDAH